MQVYLHQRGLLAATATVIALTFFTSTATAQYTNNFESLLLAPTVGVPFAPALWDATAAAGSPGQDGYYWPVGTTSATFSTQAYTGGVVTPGVNVYGIPNNPNGGTQFIVGNNPGGTTAARAQRNIPYTCNGGRWTWATDICVSFQGTLPAGQNVGSFSVQPFPGSQSFIMLATWTNLATATNWDASNIWYNAAGVQQPTYVSPNTGFQNLNINQWYRWETVADLTTNQIVEIRITNLTLATPTVVDILPAATHYMGGGSAGGPPPTGFRFFAGGSIAGNIIAYDNPSVMPPSATSASVGAGCFGITLSSLNAGPIAGGIWDMRVAGALLSTDVVTVVLKLGPTLPVAPFPAASYGCSTTHVGLGPFVIMGLMTGSSTSHNFPLSLPLLPGLLGLPMAAQGVGLDVPASQFFTTNALNGVLGC